MGLINRTGRRSPQTRLLLAGIFLLLTLGAISMALPFALMLSGATRGGVDLYELTVWPRFLTDDTVLFRKFIEARYNESPADLRAAWESSHVDFSAIDCVPDDSSEEVEAWLDFIASEPPGARETFAGFVYTPISRGRPWLVRRYMQHQWQRFYGKIYRLNDEMETSFPDWNAFQVFPADVRSRLGLEADTAWWQSWRDFLAEEAPDWATGIVNLNGFYHERVTAVLEGRDAPRPPLTPRADSDHPHWEFFVREVVHPGFVRMDAGAAPLWHELLRARYPDRELFTRMTGTDRPEDVPLPESYEKAGALSADWLAFLEGWQDLETGEVWRIPLENLRLESADLRWRERQGRGPPFQAVDARLFSEHRSELRRLFLTQHFGTVWEILILHGRGLRVTVFYCVGAVALALLVNPLAAYALSRYRPRHSYTLLLYLLLTMAFPPMVTQIPLFLMLRDLHLLNTYWALLLPGMAHGYSIFLLKGFFDSLPRELYESAAIDGAGELCMFRVITLALSKPILAVIALGAFVNAYTAFMFALLICQDERMWTLMVWLYQLQQTYGPGVMNASFVLASLPTLTVFLLAQRFILRGIVVPSEK